MYVPQVLGRTAAYTEKSSFVNFCGKTKAAQAKNHFIVHHPLILSSSSSFLLLQNVSQIFGQITTASGHMATVCSRMSLQTLSDQVSETGQLHTDSGYPV